jgi:hypothetical protein
MRGAADIVRRLRLAAWLRRLPLWFAAALPWMFMRHPAGLAACLLLVLCDIALVARHIEARWSRMLDGAVPELEDSSALLDAADTPLARLQRERLLGRVTQSLDSTAIRRIVGGAFPFRWQWVLCSVVLAVATWFWPRAHGVATPPQPGPAASDSSAELVVSVTPPAYTGVASSQSAVRELQVPQHSVVRWCAKTRELDGANDLTDGALLKPAADGCAQSTATESIFWRWRGVRHTLSVIPDQAPEITVAAPSELVQVLEASAKSVRIAFTVRDDYRVVGATLHLTLARGNGENIRFSDREMPVPVSNDVRVRSMNRQWSLAELAMEPGDELYFFVRATDNAPQPHMAQSPTYTLRLPGAVNVDDDASALPMLVKPENLRSERQIIIDTEQLLADMKAHPAMPAAHARARSEAIANDQAQLKRRYGQFLGEESSLFGGEAEHSDEGGAHDLMAQFGHKHDQAENATLFDEATKKILRRALSAMWDAEKSLRMVAPKTALPPENVALEAIKQLQQADRIYLHKTAFVPPAIKEEKRMSGEIIGAKNSRRAQSEPNAPVPPQLRQLIEALASDQPMPALWRRDAQDWIRSRITVDEQRLAAQRAVQDVADGCADCRSVLRAWLRAAIAGAPVLLHAQSVPDTAFAKAWRGGGGP